MALRYWNGTTWTAAPGIKEYNGSTWSWNKASGWDNNVARQFASDVTNPIVGVQRILQAQHNNGFNPWATTQSTNAPLAKWVVQLSISGSPTGGYFQLTYNGVSTPASGAGALAYNATAAQVETALNALSSVQALPSNNGPAGICRVFNNSGTAYANLAVGSTLPGASYTVVFPYPSSESATTYTQQLSSVGNTLTGGTSPSVSITTTPVGGQNINWNGRWTWDGTQGPIPSGVFNGPADNGINDNVNFDTNEWTDAWGGSGSSPSYTAITNSGNWSGYRHDTTTDITWYRSLLEYQALTGDNSFQGDINQMRFILWQNWFNSGYYKAWPYFELIRMHACEPWMGWDMAALCLAQTIFNSNYTNNQVILDGSEKFAYRVDYNLQCAAMLLDAGVRFAGKTCPWKSYGSVPSYTYGSANTYQQAGINVLSHIMSEATASTSNAAGVNTGLVPTTMIYVQGGTDSADTSGAALANRVQNISMESGTTGGTFSLTWNGTTYSGISYSVTAASLQTILNGAGAITNAGGCTVVSSGSGTINNGYTYSVEFNAATSQSSLITTNSSGLTPSGQTMNVVSQVFEANVFCKSGETGQDADYYLRCLQYLNSAGLSLTGLQAAGVALVNAALSETFSNSSNGTWYDFTYGGLYFGLNWDGSGLNKTYKESGRQWHWLKAIDRLVSLSNGGGGFPSTDNNGVLWTTWQNRFLSMALDYAWLNQEKAFGPTYRSNPSWTPYSDPNTQYGGSPANHYKIQSYTTEFFVTSEACGIVSTALLDYLYQRGNSPW